MACSDSNSNSNPNPVGQWTYDAFLSFAGKDTRKGFVGHLYRALDERGIYTFKDDLKLHMGDSISNELLDKIEASRFAVVVFSEKYAASSWCLDELVKIMECRKIFGQTVIPVFYHVDPFIIRRQTGTFEEAFRKHEDRFRNDLQKVQVWREALAEAAGISGLDVSKTANGDEAECIIKIVQEISSKCKTSTTVAKNLIGIESRVQDVKCLLCISSNDVRFLGIWGVGGSGKTTLAWAVYNEISNTFQGRSYVANVREVANRSGLQILQQKVLSEILLDVSIKVNNDREGIELMGRRLKRKSVLLVLDDVDDEDQLAALAGSHDWFGKGSRIIITTRDKHLLSEVNAIYNATLLNRFEALQVFSLYAFKKSEPLKEYDEYSHEVVRYANGLPLALKVLGSFLYQRGVDEWKSALNRLEVAPHDKIFEILKISFDRLSSIDQKIFLDIACFFKGKKKNQVVRILDSFGFNGDIGISELVQKSLISVSNKNLIHMHDLIQEMGWHIVRKVSDEPGKRSRLWLHTDVSHVLTNHSGTDAIEGISLDSTLEVDSGISLTKSFRKMNELRFLKLGYVGFKSSMFRSLPKVASYLWSMFATSDKLMYLPSNLRWLTWERYPFEMLPENFEAEKLVGIELQSSDIVQLWRGRKRMDNLRLIDLGRSDFLKSTPDLNWTPNLRTLILDYCSNLVNVHPSLANHRQLVSLSLKGCWELKNLPSPIRMRSLENLDLTECFKLKSFPEIVSGVMEKLLKIRLQSSGLKELPSSIGNLSGLVLLKIRYCHSLTSLPSTICSLKSLKTLDVSHCLKLEKLPQNLGQIESLEELFMRRTSIREAPSSIVLLKNLKTLSIGRCQELAASLLLSVRKYSNSTGFGLELPPLLRFSSLGTLKTLLLDNCSLSEGDIPDDLSALRSLEALDLSVNHFKHLPSSICEIPRLKILDLCWCKDLQEVQALPPSIVVLHLSYGGAKSLPDLLRKYASLCKVTLLDDRAFIDRDLPNLVMQSLLQGPLVANHRLSITFMGNRIPEWFGCQNPGNETYLQLSSNWFNKRLLGFAISAVFEELKDFPLFESSIKFDLMEEEISNMVATSQRDSHGGDGCNYMWLGFFSVSFFRLLFPDLKPDDWSAFQGCLRASFSSFECRQCAMRLVYEHDLKGLKMPTMIQNSLVLDDPMGRPWIKHNLEASNLFYSNVDDGDGGDDDEEYNDFTYSRIYLSSSTTVNLKETGSRHAEIDFQL